MPREDSAYLIDMLLAARDAVSFTEGMLVGNPNRQEISREIAMHGGVPEST